MESGLAALFWQFCNRAMLYMEPLTDYIIQLVPYAICIGIGVLLNKLWAIKKKDQSSLNGKYISCEKITYNTEGLVDSGTGSKVYRGKYETRDAAIKVIKLGPSKNYDMYKGLLFPSRSTAVKVTDDLQTMRLARELNINQTISLTSDFIVQYHGAELHRKNKTVNLLIALELCNADLQRVVDDWEFFQPLSARMVMHQLAEGLYFLHESNYVHRDLKPSNVLLKKYSNPDQMRIKLADFGATKASRCYDGNTQFSLSGYYGSDGWMAPEVAINVEKGSAEIKESLSGDVFSMGLIFYFVVTKGNRLYDGQAEIDAERLNDSATITEAFPMEMDLINRMTNYDWKERPNAASVKKHPALWKPLKIVSFIATVNEIIKQRRHDYGVQIYANELETSHNCFQRSWINCLTPEVAVEVNSTRHARYDETLMRDLIRAVRNFGIHFSTLPEHIRMEFGSFPDGYIEYWMKMFPGLLIHTYNVTNSHQSDYDDLHDFY